jgi:formylglycine-generating enzyme required for sulfatase activity
MASVARCGVATHGYFYSGSENVNAVDWYGSNAGGDTHAVGTKLANELGLFDLSGNVSESCFDVY